MKLIGPTWPEMNQHLKDLFRGHFVEYLDGNELLEPSGAFTTRRSCPVCSSATSGKPFQFIFFPIVTCGGCGFRYMQSFPDTPVLQKALDGVIKSQHPYTRTQKPEEEWVSDETMRAKVEGMVGWFRDLESVVDLPRLARGTFLDIGAAGGYAVRAAEAYGFRRAIGIEFDSRRARFSRERLKVEIVETAVERTQLPADISLIRMNHVLEHIERPVELLGRCRAALASPGVLYVGVPNMRALSVRLLSARHRYFQPVHINYFHARSLRTAATVAGFESVRILTDHFSLGRLLSDPLAASHVGKYYMQGLRSGFASRLGRRLMREAARIYPETLDRVLIRLFPLWGDNLVCLAHTNGASRHPQGGA